MIVAILQARMSSSRLPGKVLKKIVNKPVLALQLERLQRCKKIDKLVVATSIESSDEPVAKLCEDIGVECYRGNLNDVLKRFKDAADYYQASHVVRLTGDCPLADPELIDRVIALHLSDDYEFTSNIYPRSYPDGLDVEVMTKAVLDLMEEKATCQEDREHVTYYLEKRLEQFKLGNVSQSVDQSLLRWTLDNEQDLEFIQDVYQSLYPDNPNFTTQDILDYLNA